MLKVIKRDGREVDFDASKIVNAIDKAMKFGSGIYKPEISMQIADEIELIIREVRTLSIFQIEDMVYHKLIEHGEVETAKAYEGYRAIQEYKRKNNTTDDSVVGLLEFENHEVMRENSNKNAVLNSTQRDLIAGEVSKDLVKRKLFPSHLIQAHQEGKIHIHDQDYLIQPMHNCTIINLEDMLKNGTVINDKMIKSPKSFQVACTVTTQIIAQVTSSQFGGASINGIDRILAPYVKKSYDKYYEKHLERLEGLGLEAGLEEVAAGYAWEDTKKEIKDGVQTMQYQINTISGSNGQSPFVTFMLYFDPESDLAYESSLICEEILRQRYEGIDNEIGIKMPTSFPKLIYVLDEHNIDEGSEYFYLTKLSAKATAKTLMPDYISAKKMRETYEGNVFVPMGCRSFLSPWKDENGNYKFDGRFNFGVFSLNLVNVALTSNRDRDLFWNILDERLALIKEAGLLRYNQIKNTPSDVAPILWQHGAIARLKKGETIEHLLRGGYATVSLGYIGIYETVKYMMGLSHTSEEGREFALEIVNYLRETVDGWKEETKLGFALYGTPSENMAGRLARLDRENFGEIEDVTDKGYYVNSYHVDVREPIDAFSKLEFEAPFQRLSTGGTISYVEIPNLQNNLEAVLELMKHIYNTNIYAEMNTKADLCHVCGFTGEIIINDDIEWECPQCHNKDQDEMTVVRRTCGYLGSNFWGEGRTRDIKDRVLHL